MIDIEKDIKRLESIQPDAHPDKIFNALCDAIMLIKELKDEVESVWAMLDELKASEIHAHSEALKKELDKKIAETFSLINSKVALA